MKKTIVLICFLAYSVFTLAQISLNNAINFLKDGFLDDAKTSIDIAVSDDKTKDSYKAFYYKGQIYQAIGISEIPKYKALCTDCFDTAFDAYMKALNLNFVSPEHRNIDISTDVGLMQFAKIISTPDERNYQSTETLYDIILNRMPALSNAFFNMGVSNYQSRNYEKSYLCFEKAVTIATISFKVDTQLYYFTSIAALKAGKFEEAIKFNDLLIELDYGQTEQEKVGIYLNKAIAYKNLGDSENMLITLDKGIQTYPESNYTLVIEEFNYFVHNGNNIKALDCINMAISQSPDNASLIVIRATLYDQLNRKQEAEQDYLKALKTDPDNYDVNYNLGAFYFNTAVDTLQWAETNLTADKMDEYAKYKEISNTYFTNALPFLQKADALKPNNLDVLGTLKTIYYRLGQIDKYNEITVKIDALTK
jgi:tetratricopeptide (TPR) repeat protein